MRWERDPSLLLHGERWAEEVQSQGSAQRVLAGRCPLQQGTWADKELGGQKWGSSDLHRECVSGL